MNIKTFLSASVVMLLSQNAWPLEQKVLFCATQMSYSKMVSDDQCRAMCSQYSSSSCLQNQLDLGWEVGSSSSKQVIVQDNGFARCACIGTEYIIKKPDPEKIVAQPVVSADEVALLKKEIELLKKENEIQKQEISSLKERTKDKKK